MINFMIGILLFSGVCIAILSIAFKAQQSIRSSRYQSMLGYGKQTQLLQDANDLHRFSIAQQLRRRSGGLSAFGLSFNAVALIGSAAILFGPAIQEGGASVIGFGLPILALFGLAVSASLAELASAVPVTGGLFHAASALGKRKWGWRTGYFQAAGHLAMFSLINCACAALLDRLLSSKFGYLTTEFTFWTIVLAITLLQGVVNHWGRGLLGILQALGVWLQIGIGIVILLGLLWLFWPGGYSAVLLYQFENAEWNGTVTAGAFISGTVLLLKLFVGMDGASQGAEETVDPRIKVPWAIFLSTAYTFVFSFVLLAFMLLTASAAFQIGSLGFFLNAVMASTGGSVIIVFLVLGTLWGSGLHTLTMCSRCLFSLAREQALPMHKVWSSISVKQQVPYNAVWLSVLVSLVMLIPLYVSARQQMVFILLSFAIISLHISYAIPIVLKLKRGESDPLWQLVPWRLGRWSIPVNWIAVVWLAASSGLAAVYIHHWGAAAAVILALLVFSLELKNRKRNALRLQSHVHRSRKELYRMERKFPLN